jgi:predicted phage tail protein
VTGAPTGTVVTTGASIALTGELGATFSCSLDGGSYSPCPSPLVLTGLADGNHTVSVKQVDAAGNTSTLVGTAGWAVDASVPAATEVAKPADTTSTTSEVAFETTPGMTAECSLDGDAFQACTSPVSVSGLAVGQHTLKVRMVNTLGTPGVERAVTWTVSAPVAETPAKTATTTTTATPAAPATTTIVPAACVSRRAVEVHWTMPGAAKAKAFKVLVDGKVVKTLSGKARAYKVSLAGRGAASVKVQVKAVTTSGRGFTTTRVYKTCATKAGDPSLPTVVLKSGKA